MKKQIKISPSLPEPARQLVTVIQTLLRVSRQESLRLIHQGYVTVNGRVRNQSRGSLDGHDLIEVEYLPKVPKPTLAKAGAHQPLEVMFEDEYLIVVNKPPNVLTVPTPHREKITLQSMVQRYLQKYVPEAKAYCVHRLDRGVSGVLVMAKSLEVAEGVRSQFAARKPQRKYTAIVFGSLDQDRGTIRSYLATDQNLNRYSTLDKDQGELAITHFRKTLALKNATMVEVQLETGRRNQIRVHMAELGFPILGDPRYGKDNTIHPAWVFRRLALHAETLGFNHPVTGEELKFQSPWPEEFRQFKRKCEIQRGPTKRD